MIKLTPAIVVEGRYDKNKLSQIFDTVIIETNGFGIFKDEKKTALLRRIAETRGLVVFTDPDGAGLLIRNRIKSCISTGRIYHAYIPDIYGKEKRKSLPSKEGKLGVEGVSDDIIIQAVRNSGAFEEEVHTERLMTKQKMYELGLSGDAGSKKAREELIKKLSLPENLSANALVDAINALSGDSSVEELINNLRDQQKEAD